METRPAYLPERDREQEVSKVREDLQEWVDNFTLGERHVHLSAIQAQLMKMYGDDLPDELHAKVIELALAEPVCVERLSAWTNYVSLAPISPED